MCNCKNKSNSHCDYCDFDPIKTLINPVTLTTSAVTPLILTNNESFCNSNIVFGTNSVIFSKIGVYNIKGYINLINQSTSVTNFQILVRAITGSAIINPNTIVSTGVKLNMPLKMLFNFNVQVTVPNTIIQVSVNSSVTPVVISGGKIKITKLD